MRRVCAVLVLWMLAWASLAANVWNTTEFTAWSDRDLQKVLNDSPWAGKGSITHAAAGGTRGPVPDWKVTVTWRSALPIKQGLIREQIGEHGTVPPELAPVLTNEEDFYVLGVSGLPAMYAAGPMFEAVIKRTSLVRSGKPPIAPVAARGVLIGPDGTPMEPPAPGRGGFGGLGGAPGGFGRGGGGGGGGGGAQATAMLVFFFPKADAITAADRDVEFATVVGQYNVKRRFRVRDMTVKGQLAL